MRVALLLLALLALLAIAACGEDEAPPPPPAAAARAAEATLARAKPRAGEIVVRGQGSPASHGPIELRGSYLVRFEQYAPEAPRLDFGAEASFVATLDRGMGRESVPLFERAARTGRRRVRVTGGYELTIAFGDFPYVVRFTPR